MHLSTIKKKKIIRNQKEENEHNEYIKNINNKKNNGSDENGEYKVLEFFIDNCSCAFQTNEIDIIKITNHDAVYFHTANGESHSANNNGLIQITFNDDDYMDIPNAVYNKTGPNLISSFQLAKLHAMYDRSTEGYLLQGNRRIQIEQRHGHATVQVKCKVQQNSTRPIDLSQAYTNIADIREVLTTAEIKHRRNGHVGLRKECTTCAIGKHRHKNTTATIENTAQDFLDEVAIDICGPVNESITNKRYAVIIIDLHTRWVFTYCIQYKHEVTQAVTKFCQFIGYPKIWKSDNAKEQISDKITTIIKPGTLKLCPAYEQNYNGHVERCIRTLTTITRCILFDAKLSHKYWSFAFNYAATIKNMQKHSSTSTTPWFSRYKEIAPTDKLHIFGCKASILAPKEIRNAENKFSTQSQTGIFLGTDVIANVQIIQLPNGTITMGKQVIFFEKTKALGDIDTTVLTSLQEFDHRSDYLHQVQTENPQFGMVDMQQQKTRFQQFTDDLQSQNNAQGINNNIDNLNQIVYNNNQASQADQKTIDNDEHVDTIISSEDYITLYMNTTIDKTLPKWQKAIDREYKKHMDQETFRQATEQDWYKHKRAYNKPPMSSAILLKEKKHAVGETDTEKGRLVCHGNKILIQDKNKLAHVIDAITYRLIHSLALDNPTQTTVTIADATGAYLMAPYMSPQQQPQPIIRLDQQFADRCGYTFAIPLKGINGLQYSGYSWELHRNKILQAKGFIPSQYNPAIFYRNENITNVKAPHDNENKICILTTVDDFEFIGYNSYNEYMDMTDELNLRADKQDDQNAENTEFVYTNTTINWDKKEHVMQIDQTEYAQDIVQRFDKIAQSKNFNKLIPITPQDPHIVYTDVNEANNKTRQQVAGSINYLVTISRPDLTYATRYLASMPGSKQANMVAKNIIRYLRHKKILHFFGKNFATNNQNDMPYAAQTIAQALQDFKIKIDDINNTNIILASIDADHGGQQDRHSLTGCVIYHNNNPVIYTTKRQTIIAQSPFEAEIMAQHFCYRQATMIKNILQEVRFFQKKAIIILETDSQAAIDSYKSDELTKKSKYLDIKYLSVKQALRNKELQIMFKQTDAIAADGMTKALDKNKFTIFMKQINIKTYKNKEDNNKNYNNNDEIINNNKHAENPQNKNDDKNDPEEIKQWSRLDMNAKYYRTTNKNGPPMEQVFRRNTINIDTKQIIEDRITTEMTSTELHGPIEALLPNQSMNIRTILYYTPYKTHKMQENIITWLVETDEFFTPMTCRQNPSKLYIFGENAKDFQQKTISKTTQAVIRQERNAFPIRTCPIQGQQYFDVLGKPNPTAKKQMVVDTNKILHVLKKRQFNTVVISTAGVGTGKANLKEGAPMTYDFLINLINRIKLGKITTDYQYKKTQQEKQNKNKTEFRKCD